MPNPLPAKTTASCPRCGQWVAVRAEMAGRLGQCPQCGEVFRIGAVPAGDPSQPPTPPPVAPPQPKHVSFNCSLCDTRMTIAVAHVGKKVKCPDCGRVNVVPPPPQPKAAVVPAAMLGEQYELWGVDEDPQSAQQIAQQQASLPVQCELCGTLMYATVDQVGAKLKCPDCGRLATVAPPKAKKPNAPQPADAGEEYELDPASAPTPRPVPKIIALVEAERHEAARAIGRDQRSAPAAGHVPGYAEPRETAPLPSLWRAARMLHTETVLVWTVMLSCLANVILWLGMQITSATAGGMGAIMAICFLAGAIMIGTLWFLAAASLWLAIIAESADGHDRLHSPPTTNPLEWFGEGAYLFVAMGMGTIPGGLLVKFAPWPLEASLAVGGAVWLAFLPLALLSALEQGSPMAVVSPRLWGTLLSRPAAWLWFYFQAAAIWAAAAGLLYLGRNYAIYIGPLLAIAAAMAFFRLLGLLAWRLADSTATEESQVNDH